MRDQKGDLLSAIFSDLSPVFQSGFVSGVLLDFSHRSKLDRTFEVAIEMRFACMFED